jgi:hypothetical protein
MAEKSNFSLISHVREHKNNLIERFEASQNSLCIRHVSDLYPTSILRISYVYPLAGAKFLLNTTACHINPKGLRPTNFRCLVIHLSFISLAFV